MLVFEIVMSERLAASTEAYVAVWLLLNVLLESVNDASLICIASTDDASPPSKPPRVSVIESMLNVA